MNIIEKEGSEGFYGQPQRTNTVVDYHLPPRTERDKSIQRELCPPLLGSYMLAPNFTEVRPLRLGRCNIKCSMSPWSGQDGQIDNPIALQG